jgi:hypothetical protein
MKNIKNVEKANGRKIKPKGVASELYTTEGGESRKQSLLEQTVADPDKASGAEAIEKATMQEEEKEDVE